MMKPTLFASPRRRRGRANRVEASVIFRNLRKTFPSFPTLGYANDSWTAAAIGWWGGEP